MAASRRLRTPALEWDEHLLNFLILLKKRKNLHWSKSTTKDNHENDNTQENIEKLKKNGKNQSYNGTAIYDCARLIYMSC